MRISTQNNVLIIISVFHFISVSITQQTTDSQIQGNTTESTTQHNLLVPTSVKSTERVKPKLGDAISDGKCRLCCNIADSTTQVKCTLNRCLKSPCGTSTSTKQEKVKPCLKSPCATSSSTKQENVKPSPVKPIHPIDAISDGLCQLCCNITKPTEQKKCIAKRCINVKTPCSTSTATKGRLDEFGSRVVPTEPVLDKIDLFIGGVV